MEDRSSRNPGPPHSPFDRSDQPSTSSQQDDDDYEPKHKQMRMIEQNMQRHPMRLPIILPRLPSKPSISSHGIRLMTSPPAIKPTISNPRPLISLLDRTEFRDQRRMAVTQPVVKQKKRYYTEVNEIRREYGIPETFETTKPTTMSGVALADKLKLLQRYRGENKFLQEAIQTKEKLCDEKTAMIEQIRQSTNETTGQCHIYRETLHMLESDNLELRNQLR